MTSDPAKAPTSPIPTYLLEGDGPPRTVTLADLGRLHPTSDLGAIDAARPVTVRIGLAA